MSLQSSFNDLKSSFDNNDLPSVGKQLPQVKLILTKSGLLFPSGSSHSEDDLVLARSTLEIGAFYAIRSGNVPAFERYMAQLESFYSSPSLPESSHRASLLSLQLLSLLSTSRTSAFHTLLETLPLPLLSSPPVASIIELERGLMEGSYNLVWRKAKALLQDQSNETGMGGLADQLVASIRNEIALSFSTSYTSLPIPSAQHLLFFESASEVTAFAQKRGWSLSPSSATIFFPPPTKEEALGPNGEDKDGMKGLIVEALGYAKELEAIV